MYLRFFVKVSKQMNNFFNFDGPFFTIMNRAADLIVLNVIYLLCCIPIITIGPATTALFYVTTKMTQGEDAYVVRNFFKSFKQNFVQSLVLWLLMLLFGAFVAVDLWCVFFVDFGFNDFAMPFIFIITLLYLMTCAYVFPLQSRFENKIRYTIKNALLLSFYNLPFTVIFIAVFALEVFVIVRYLPYALALYLLFAIAAVAYGVSYLYMRIFKRYLKEEDALPDPAQADAWSIPESYDEQEPSTTSDESESSQE